jgi:5-oxoprolinase (ATP-hydrolysing)
VVALEKIARQLDLAGAVGLDMGGTSTDVSRFDGRIGRRQESEIAGIRVLSPMMDIHTVAAGGGSICGVRDGRLFVGPESAGADPGPACYGRGGPLTITDINVILGRLPIERFPFKLNPHAATEALQACFQTIDSAIASTVEELAEGFLKIAVTEMAEAARVVTTAAGNDVRKMSLVGFGGAAGGHLCRVAEALDMHHAVDHPQAGILSAVGIGNAPIGRLIAHPFLQTIAAPIHEASERQVLADHVGPLRQLVENLHQQSVQLLTDEESIGAKELASDRLDVRVVADLRYVGTQSAIELPIEPIETLASRMDAKHQDTFGYARPTMPIEIVVARGEAIVRPEYREAIHPDQANAIFDAKPGSISSGWPLYDRNNLIGGTEIHGPAIVASPHSILIVEDGWTASVNQQNWIELHRSKDATAISLNDSSNDSVEMEIVARRVQGIAEAMGEVIRRTSVSVNVKERRDYSCAVFLGDGSLVANAPHVPVHLGSMGHCVRSLIEAFPEMRPGDCFISNDPFMGGSHLPDVTVVTPVFCRSNINDSAIAKADFFVASRCHHAEIGGMVPGSMAPQATCLADEGVVLRNLPLVYQGRYHHEEIRHRLSTAKYPSRNVAENMADIAAAEAAGREGVTAIQSLAQSVEISRLDQLLRRLLDVAGEATANWIESLGYQELSFADSLDDGTPVCVRMIPHRSQRQLTIDFAGTGEVHPNGFNATRSIVTAAVLYVLRCVTPNELTLCDGVLRRIDLIIPPGLLDPPGDQDPEKCPAVVAGNVETSNRVVDVLLGALGVVAASQGTMNNLLIGDETFGYYETIGGGAGASADSTGANAVHTHMTNTRITDPEILEMRLPLRLTRFAIRHGSGGSGQNRGGNGMIREIEFLRPLQVSMITSRRTTSPYGIQGGQPGQPGRQVLIRGQSQTKLGSSFTAHVQSGDRIRIETPGGGGFGSV